MAERLDPETVERVLRRAMELQPSPADADEEVGVVDEAVLVEAAAEAGIDPGAVRASLALEDLDTSSEPTWIDRVVGPARVTVTRVVSAPADDARAGLDAWLSASGRLVAIRRTDGTTEWVPRTGVWAALGALRRPALSKEAERADRLVADVRPADRSTVIRLTCDRRTQRSEAGGSGAVVSAAGVLGSVAALTVLVPGFLLVSIPVIGAGGWIAMRGRRRADDLASDLDRLLDVVAAGERPPSMGERFRRPRSG